jgi:hypothetical protein
MQRMTDETQIATPPEPPPVDAVRLVLDASSVTSASLELNGVPCVSTVTVWTKAPLCAARLALWIEAPDAPTDRFEVALENVAANSSLAVDTAEFTVPALLLRRSTERERIDVVAALVAASGDVLASARQRLVVVPASHWCGVDEACESIAAFVTPNAAALCDLMLEASKRLEQRTGSGALDGYLSGSAERVQRIVEACYEALATRGITYAVLQASFETRGQKVRTATEVLNDAIGNCLDLSVTLAALLEACGLLPALVIGDGHALVAVATLDAHFPEPVHDGPSRLQNRIELGEMRVVEATGVCGAKQSFAEALIAGERFVAQASDAIRVVDVRAARRAGFHPIPERLEALRPDDARSVRRTAKESAWVVVQPVGLPPLAKPKLAPHAARLEQWMKRLLDLSMRNRLLNDRYATTGVPLAFEGDDALGALEAALWNEKSLRVVALARAGSVLTGIAAREELDNGWLRTALSDEELFTRATKIYREAKSSIEETGARSLYVAIGYLEYRVEQRDTAVVAPILLVPVDMERISRSEGFRVRAAVDDTVVNVALVEYLHQTLALDLGLSGAIPEDDHGLDVPAVLARVRQAVKDVPGFTVLARAKLGTYSSKKLPLFEEMRARRAELPQHAVVRGLLDRSAPPSLRDARLPEPEDVDREARFTTMRLPLAADSSQIAAVLAATSGATFVLQGPPGTGKSQTIANLLSECLARGKRVLFIAEKRAALQVVSDRMNRAGLGAFMLDLHGEHATKTRFVAQIKAALESLEARATPGSRRFESVGAEFDRRRDQLRASCDALHGAPARPPQGEIASAAVTDAALELLSPHAALDRSVASASAVGDSGLVLEGVLPAQPSEADIASRLDAVARLAAAWRDVPPGVARELADFAPKTRLSHEQALAAGRDARDAILKLATVEAAARDGARDLGVGTPETRGQVRAVQAVLRAFALEASAWPALAAVALAPDGSARLEALARAVELCEQAATAESWLAARYDRSVLDLPLASLAGDLRASREQFFVMRFFTRRRVRQAILRVAKEAPSADVNQLLADIEELLAAQGSIEAAVPQRAALALFETAGHVDLVAARAAIERVREAVRVARLALPRELAKLAAAIPPSIASGALLASARALDAAVAALDLQLTRLGAVVLPTPPFLRDDAAPAELRSRLERLAGRANDLSSYSAYTAARWNAAESGLAPVAAALDSGALAVDKAERASESALLASWVRARLAQDPALAACGSDRMDELRRAFLAIVAEYRRGASDAISNVVRDRTGKCFANEGDDPALRAAIRTVTEMRALTTIRRPIRRVMLEGAAAITVLKPIVLASPLSAATFMPPEFPLFDLVVFDEASQVPVWDAACALSRARAAVIVGDSKQLPPTNFFERKDSGDLGEREGAIADSLEALESVLEECIASGIPQRTLLWHYRSRDERLIEFSNRRSYRGRLQTFPAPFRAHPNLGVEFRFVRGVYDRAKTATNRLEAEAVVAELTRRLLDPDACSANRSIGVVTFSMAQQTLVQDLLDEAVDRDPRLSERLAESAESGEEVFVKNLENVQGDERATMLFSIAYGRDSAGVLHHNFGPLNLSGGERRLNVAVSRAREKILVFASIHSSDLDPSKCRSPGAQDLRDYLAFAELGTLPASRDESAPPRAVEVSAVEEALAALLEARGWRVDRHVGRSRDYRVSLALTDPARPERWALGVELDGAFHRAAPTVVDREVVRDGVLSSLGWRTLRVSCLDYLRDPKGLADRIDAAARAATN